ncbi:hypothetical protein [Phytohabitans houttuyneae]|uniref:hypothetical protein n=1 Tax=Phytohabitans houttuyneae TaxID=1076126 RepID=UPI001C498BFF|nr:hypothetical protein [Phytohabitans houttuyneae]
MPVDHLEALVTEPERWARAFPGLPRPRPADLADLRALRGPRSAGPTPRPSVNGWPATTWWSPCRRRRTSRRCSYRARRAS